MHQCEIVIINTLISSINIYYNMSILQHLSLRLLKPFSKWYFLERKKKCKIPKRCQGKIIVIVIQIYFRFANAKRFPTHFFLIAVRQPVMFV